MAMAMAMARLAMALALLPACGDNGVGFEPFEPTASGIFPAEAYLGRRARVEISGVGTHWDENVGVDFGDGIAVGTVSVASPTTIFADIAVDTAEPGFNDVRITDGDEVLVLKKAFLLRSPIELRLQGNIAQGAIGLFSIINHDFAAPFDTSSFQESAFESPVFVNLQITGPHGVTFAIDEVTPYTITGQVLVDVDAEAKGPLEVISGPVNEAIHSPLGRTMSIMPRVATAITGPTTTRTVSLPFESHLYAFTPATAPHIARFAVTSAEPLASPRVAILGASGHFDDVLARAAARSTQVAVSGAETYYAIYFDGRGTSQYSYTLTATSSSLSELVELEPNNDPGSAQQDAAPLLLDHATLVDQGDEDWVAIPIGPGEVGKRIHVITTSADPMTDTRVDVLSASMISLGGPSSDSNYHEDFTSTPTTVAGTYYVRIGASQTAFFEVAHNTYAAAIFLE